jgi:hypothetical protein
MRRPLWASRVTRARSRAPASRPMGRALPGHREHGAELVAVQAGGLAVVGDLGPAHVSDGRAHQHALVNGVLVEAGQRGQTPRDGRGRPPGRLELAGVQLDMHAGRLQDCEVVSGAPAPPVGQVATVGGAGVPGVAGQERQRERDGLALVAGGTDEPAVGRAGDKFAHGDGCGCLARRMRAGVS